jgi:hypothetical protein
MILFLLLAPMIGAAQQSTRYQIRFGRNKYELSVQHKETLTLISDSLIGKTNYIIYINGHADSEADSSYNQQLSLKRSLAVKEYLAGKGIDDSLFRVQAMGEDQPLVANTTPLERAKNRRVELLVLFQQKPQEEVVQIENEVLVPGCNTDTSVTLEGGYRLTMSICDWERNKQCLRVVKNVRYEFKMKERWLAKHIGFKNYRKLISYQPHYEFYIVSCVDSCFRKPMKLFISHYQAPGLQTSARYSQRKITMAAS